MKVIGMAVVLLLFFVVNTSYAVVGCTSLASEQSCEFSGCYWCERCTNNQGNTFGQDMCVQSNGDCFHTCSMLCGSQCNVNSDCKNLLNTTDDTCMYSGLCSSCSCKYVTEYCPQNGTIVGDVCHYGKRECSSSGCAISKCTLSAGEVCDPEEGCVSCDKDDCGTNGDYLRDYECRGSEVFAERVVYFCNATACLFSKSDALIERCDNGCFEGKCLEPKCNFNGVVRDCSSYDGFFEQSFCKGNDVYRYYRDYYCGAKDCEFDTSDRLIERCPVACNNGACVNQAASVEVAVTNEPTGKPEQKLEAETEQAPKIYSGNVYNGLLFGQRNLDIMASKSGTIFFEVKNANRISNLRIFADGKEVFAGRPEEGQHSVDFTGPGEITFSADSSGWVFFMPNSYYLASVRIVYD